MSAVPLSTNDMFTSEGVALLLAGPFVTVSSIKMPPALVTFFLSKKKADRLLCFVCCWYYWL